MQQDHVTIETPEHIQFTYELAGLGSRFLSLFVDSLIQIIGFGILAALLAYLETAIGSLTALSGRQVAGVPILWLIFLISTPLLSIGYFIFFEMMWAGQSPGKRMAGLRITRVSGQQIGFTESAIRNILRLVDVLPTLYAAGILFVFFTARCQRIGDLAAGTIVVKERLWEPPEAEEEPVAQFADMGREEQLARQARGYIAALSRDEIEAVRRFIQRRGELSPELRTRLASDIAAPLYQKFPGLRLGERPNPEWFLEIVHQAYLEHQARM